MENKRKNMANKVLWIIFGAVSISATLYGFTLMMYTLAFRPPPKYMWISIGLILGSLPYFMSYIVHSFSQEAKREQSEENAKKIKMMYKTKQNGKIVFAVDKQTDSAQYDWRILRPGTKTWETVHKTDQPMYTTNKAAAELEECSFMCRVYNSRDYIIAYTSIATIDRDYYPKREYCDSHGREYSRTVDSLDNTSADEFHEACKGMLVSLGYSKGKKVEYERKATGFTTGVKSTAPGFTAGINSTLYYFLCVNDSQIGSKTISKAGWYGKKTQASQYVIIANGSFTEEAQKQAEEENIQLWDRKKLAEMMDRIYGFNQNRYSSKSNEEEKKHREEKQKKEREDKKKHEEYREAKASHDNGSGFDFFAGCVTKNQAVSRYRNLTKAYHPDTGSGDDEIMKTINLQYERTVSRLG